MKINYIKLRPGAIVPRYAHASDAGADLLSIENVKINPGEWRLVGTGIAIEIPSGFVGLIHPRSGLAAKSGLTVLNAPGTIDSNYRGELKVNLINHSPLGIEIEKGDRIAQIVFQAYEKAEFVHVAEFYGDTDRGINGHGSTGVK